MLLILVRRLAGLPRNLLAACHPRAAWRRLCGECPCGECRCWSSSFQAVSEHMHMHSAKKKNIHDRHTVHILIPAESLERMELLKLSFPARRRRVHHCTQVQWYRAHRNHTLLTGVCAAGQRIDSAIALEGYLALPTRTDLRDLREPRTAADPALRQTPHCGRPRTAADPALRQPALRQPALRQPRSELTFFVCVQVPLEKDLGTKEVSRPC